MRIHVIGLGSIGSLISHHLRTALAPQHAITLILKHLSYVHEARERGGITVERDGFVQKSTGYLVEDVASTSQYSTEVDAPRRRIPNHPTRIDSLIIATKAPHTVPVVRSLLPRLAPHCTIVLLQNGMGVYEELVDFVFRNRDTRPHFIFTCNTHGAWSRSRNNVVHTGWGQLMLGIAPDPLGLDFEKGFFDDSVSEDQRTPHLSDIADPSQSDFDRYQSLRNTMAALLLLKPLRPSWVPFEQIFTTMRRKLVVNSVINPLTAIMNCRNGDIFTSESALLLMRRICLEASLVFAAQDRREAGEEESDDDGEGDVLDKEGSLQSVLSPESLQKECLRVANLTAQNYSSMLLDVLQGRDTEIHYMNGYLLNQGKIHRLNMPATLAVTQMLNMRRAIPLDLKKQF